MTKLIIYPNTANGLPLTNPYARIVCVVNEQVWDNTNQTLDADCAYADSVISLTQNEYHGGYPVNIPAALPAGFYDMLIYDAASPSVADQVQLGKRIQWSCGQITIQES